MVLKAGFESARVPSPTKRGDLGNKLAISSITETESMEKFRSEIFWVNGRESRHQFQINREN
jgi:hypothetical protein